MLPPELSGLEGGAPAGQPQRGGAGPRRGLRRVAVVLIAAAAVALVWAQLGRSGGDPGGGDPGGGARWLSPSSLLVVMPSFMPQKQQPGRAQTAGRPSQDWQEAGAVGKDPSVLSSLAARAGSRRHEDSEAAAAPMPVWQRAEHKLATGLSALRAERKGLQKQLLEQNKLQKQLLIRANKPAGAGADVSAISSSGSASGGRENEPPHSAHGARATAVHPAGARGDAGTRASTASTAHKWLHGVASVFVPSSTIHASVARTGTSERRERGDGLVKASRGRRPAAGEGVPDDGRKNASQSVTSVLHILAREQRAEIASVEEQLKLETLSTAEEDSRGKVGWGLVNPENGVMRVECGDSVADGGGGTSPDLRSRFWGPVGSRFLVQCPEFCGKFSKATVWGCDTFMDASSICKAAILSGKIGYDSGGYVAFELVEPVARYGGCQKGAVSEYPVPAHREVSRLTFTSMSYTWYEWDRADRPESIGRFGEDGAILKYRTSCKSADDPDECYGRFAYRLTDANMEFVPVPTVLLPEGEYLGKVLITMRAPTCVEQIHYTLDGSDPDMQSPVYEGPFYITNVGNTTLTAMSYSSSRSPYESDRVSLTYSILAAAEPPLVSSVGSSAQDSADLVIDRSFIELSPQEQNDTVYFTTDGEDPTEDSEVYSEPILVTSALVGKAGTVILKAMAVSSNETMEPSPVVTKGYTAIEACAAPEISPQSGTVLVPLEGDRVSISCTGRCSGHFTEDGSIPTPGSTSVNGQLRMSPGFYTIKAVCAAHGFADSDVVTADFESRVRTSAPTFVPDHLDTEEPTGEMRILPAMMGSKILFTIDGSVPTENSSSTYTCGVNLVPSDEAEEEGTNSTSVEADTSGEADSSAAPAEGSDSEEEGEVGAAGARRRLLSVWGGRGRVGLDNGVEALLRYGGPSYWKGPATGEEMGAKFRRERGKKGLKPSLGIDRLLLGDGHSYWRGPESAHTATVIPHGGMAFKNSVSHASITQTLSQPDDSFGVTSEVTVDGCLVTMGPGLYNFKAVAIAPDTPCVDCPEYAPSRMVTSGQYHVDPPGPPSDESQPSVRFFIEGPGRNGGSSTANRGDETEPVDGAVILKPPDFLYVQLECPDLDATPQYTVNQETVTQFSRYENAEQSRNKNFVRFQLVIGDQTVRAVCYKGGRQLSTVKTVHLYVIKQPKPPRCKKDGAVFKNVLEGTTIRLGQLGNRGNIVYSINGQQEACPHVGKRTKCEVWLGATTCRDLNVSVGRLSRSMIDETVPTVPQRRLLSAPAPEPCVYHITAWVDAWGHAQSSSIECEYTVEGAPRSAAPTFSIEPGYYEVPFGGTKTLDIDCLPQNGDPRVGIDELATTESTVVRRKVLSPGTTTINAICWSKRPATAPSPMKTGVYVIKEQAPMVRCSRPSNTVFDGEDEGVTLTLTDDHAFISYTLQQPGYDGEPNITTVDCAASSCKVYLPSFCDYPMQDSDTETVSTFRKFYPQGCPYVLKAWAESSARARSPIFVGRYLVVPHPVAEAPVFTTSIEGGGEEQSPDTFVIAPGARVILAMDCATGGTLPKYGIGPDVEPSDRDSSPTNNRITLDKGAKIYKARCFGSNARPSPVTERTYTVVVRAQAPQSSRPSNTELLGGPGEVPKVRLSLVGANRKGSIEWSADGPGMAAPGTVSGTCEGTSTSCWVQMILPDCRPWESGETSCVVTVTAKTVMAGALDSPTKSWTYLITPPPPVAAPTFDPSPSDEEAHIEPFNEGLPVTITCGDGSEARYTLNGQKPTRFSTRYTGPVTVQRGVTYLQAICVRDGLIGGSGVTGQKFRVVTDSPDEGGDVRVLNRAPPPTSNPPNGATIDAVSITAIELRRSQALSRSQITYTTSLDGVTSEPVTCHQGHRCDVPLPVSCGSSSQDATMPRDGRAAVTCDWSLSAFETVPLEPDVTPSDPIAFNFKILYPARAGRPLLFPAPQPLVEEQASGEATPFVVDCHHELPVEITCPTPSTYPRYSIGATTTVGASSPLVPASGQIMVPVGFRVIHAICQSDDKHVLPSLVEAGSFYVLERVPTPVSQPPSGSVFNNVFTEAITISDSFTESIITYQLDGQEPVECSGSKCNLVLSSDCAAATGSSDNETECSYTISATASAPERAISHSAVFHFTLTKPPFASSPTFSPAADGNVSVVGFDESLPVTIECSDPGAVPHYVLMPDDVEEKPEVTEYSAIYEGPILLSPRSSPGMELGVEGMGGKDGVTVIHAVCYSPALRLSPVASARYDVSERAPTPTFVPLSKSFQWTGGEPIDIRIRDTLPQAELAYKVNNGEWQDCSDGNDVQGEGESHCYVKLDFTCADGDDIVVDHEGYSQCTFVITAIAFGSEASGMSESLTTSATYVIRVPPPLAGPTISPDPKVEQVIESGADSSVDVSITCPLGAQPHYSLIGEPTKYSPLFTPGAVSLHAGVHTVRAICYLPSREQESEVVTVKYTVIQRAPNPECHPPSGSALAGNGGTVPVVLSVPLAESAIVFTVNGGDASECGSNEVCQLNLPVICPGQQESGGEPPARRRLLSDTEGAEGGDSDSAAAEDIPVCTYTIVAVGEATGYLESHPAVFTFTVADTTTANAATDNFIHSGNPSSGHIVQVGANGADGTPGTITWPANDGQIVFDEESSPVIPAPPPVDIAKPPPVHITSPPPVHFTRAPPLDFSRDSKVPVLTHESNVEISDIEPQISPPLPVMVNSEPPDAGPHEIGGWYKALDKASLKLVPPKDSTSAQRAVFNALAQQSQTDKLEAEVYKKRIMQLAARINAELARVRLAEKRGHDDKSDVLQAKLQQHAQQFDLQHERDMLVALNSVIGKYQALAAAPDSAATHQVKHGACARVLDKSLPAVPKGWHAQGDWAKAYHSIAYMDFCWCKYDSVLERIGCQERAPGIQERV